MTCVCSIAEFQPVTSLCPWTTSTQAFKKGTDAEAAALVALARGTSGKPSSRKRARASTAEPGLEADDGAAGGGSGAAGSRYPSRRGSQQQQPYHDDDNGDDAHDEPVEVQGRPQSPSMATVPSSAAGHTSRAPSIGPTSTLLAASSGDATAVLAAANIAAASSLHLVAPKVAKPAQQAPAAVVVKPSSPKGEGARARAGDDPPVP